MIVSREFILFGLLVGRSNDLLVLQIKRPCADTGFFSQRGAKLKKFEGGGIKNKIKIQTMSS